MAKLADSNSDLTESIQPPPALGSNIDGSISLAGLPIDELVGCHECDLLMQRAILAIGEKAQCPRCGHELYACRDNVVQRSLALTLSALLLYAPANFLPIMHLELLGLGSDDTVWGGVVGLYENNMAGVALVVFLCSMGLPLLKLCCQLMVLLSIKFNFAVRQSLALYRLYGHLREWGMPEVYLMGILVAIVKLADMATLSIGVGLLCFVAFLIVQIFLEVVMSPQQIWGALGDRKHASN